MDWMHRQKKTFWVLAVCVLGVLVLPAFFNDPGSLAAPPDFIISLDEVTASGFTQPVHVTGAQDGSGRLFVVEQTGQIKIIQNGSVLATPFLNLSSKVSCCGERGLLGLAFHPNYRNNGYFFVDYTDANGNTVVARYRVSGNANLADPNSALVLFTVAQPFANHNGGHLAFGPDHNLYIAMGDGGSGGDPYNNGQNLTSPLGKLLRVDVDSASPYAIPADNPYATHATADRRIWAWGLRNPWRFSFDRVTGDLYVGDVGQNAWEEINFQMAGTPGGQNYGWRCMEGFHVYNTQAPCDSQSYLNGLTAPILDYSHTEGHSVTGGMVYRGTRYPRLSGTYFYADFVDGKVWSIRLSSRSPLTWSSPKLELTTGFSISSFGEGDDGEIYLTDYSGKIRHLSEASPVLSGSSKSVSPLRADAGETVTYTIRLVNTGATGSPELALSDSLPSGLTYAGGSASASSGTLTSPPPNLAWNGVVQPNSTVTLTYQATVNSGFSGSILNSALVTGLNLTPLTLSTSLSVPKAAVNTTVTDFFIPGTQPNTLSHSLVDAQDCDICHSAPVYDRWRGSAMSQAGRDPLAWAAIAVGNALVENGGEYCLRCHTPQGWFMGRSQPASGSALMDADIRNGIACQICHRMVDPVASASDEAKSIDEGIRQAISPALPSGFLSSGMMILDPQDRRRGPFTILANPARHSAWKTDFLSQDADAATRSRICSTCHNVDNPVFSWDPSKGASGQYWPNTNGQAAPSFASGALFPVERTYTEWSLSQYALGGVYAPAFAGKKPGGMVSACQDCHMPRGVGLAADFPDPVLRDCGAQGCLPEHDLLGANTWLPGLLQSPAWRLNATNDAAYLTAAMQRTRLFLRKAATLSVALEENAGNKSARVRVTNQTGHKLPTGYPEGRRMWLNVRAYDMNGQLVYESGAYNAASGELTLDAQIKIYEAVQGITPELAAVLQLPAGPSFHFMLNNTVIKDNRIPPRGFTNAAYNQPGLTPVGASYSDGQYWDETLYALPPTAQHVTARLYYQVASKEYIDFLKQYGGLDGASLQALWTASKSSPEWVAYAPMYLDYFPIIGR